MEHPIFIVSLITEGEKVSQFATFILIYKKDIIIYMSTADMFKQKNIFNYIVFVSTNCSVCLFKAAIYKLILALYKAVLFHV